MPENIDDVINIDIELDDGSGNTHTETLGPYLVKSQSLKPVEKNGDPREKMNILIIGNEMSTSETEDALEERLNWYFNQGDMEIHKKYRDFFNWYILDTEKRICSKDIGGLDSDDDCPAMEESGDLLSQSDEIKGGHLSYIVMSSQDFRSYAGYSSSLRGRSVIADQQPWGDDNVFAHELGHLIWGFDDEYGFDNTITGAGRTYGFFTHSDETENFNIEKYSNTFPQEQNCKSNMSTYYPRLDQSDCWYQDAEEPGWIVRTASKGESLMSGDPPIYYQTHKKRIKYLIENNPIYEGVIN